MPRRGLSETSPVRFGSVYMTAAVGSTPAGNAAGRPLNGAVLGLDAHDPNPGRTVISAMGEVHTIVYATPHAGGLIELEFRFTWCDPTVAASLRTAFATGAAIDPLVIPLSDGRTWSGKCKPDRRKGKMPVEELSSDHPHYGGQLRELAVRVLTTEGGFL